MPRNQCAVGQQTYRTQRTRCVPERYGHPVCRWSIRHGAEDYKTGGTYGERPPLLLSPELYPELEVGGGSWGLLGMEARIFDC